MPEGIPMTEDERRMRHKMIYGEGAEPPAERTGRNAPEEDRGGRPFGVPRTDEERQARHKELHGEGSEAPAERIGRNPMPMVRPGYYPVITGGAGGKTTTTWVRQGDVPDSGTLEPVSITIAGLVSLGKVIIVIVAAGAAITFLGYATWKMIAEKRVREGLPPFQLIVAGPKPEDMNDPNATYVLKVVGAVKDRKVSIKFGKAGELARYSDPDFREGHGEFTVEVTGRELANAAQKKNFLTGRIPGLRESGDVTVSMYAMEERKPFIRDIVTPVTAVRIHIPSEVERTAENIAKVIPCITGPRGVSADAAATGRAAGKQYYIKSSLPIFCCLPGLPYVPGMWVPPMCVISETA